MKARSSELPACGKDNDDGDDLDGDDLCDDVSAMTMNDDDTAFKSVHFSGSVASGASGVYCNIRPPKHTKIQLMNVVDVWKDKKLMPRCSVQVLLPSGTDPHCSVDPRVSTSQKELVIQVLADSNMDAPEQSFGSVLLNTAEIKKDKTGMMHQCFQEFLDNHPKYIAHHETIARLKSRDASKQRVEVHRIPLPFKCAHELVSPVEDELFHMVRRCSCILTTLYTSTLS